MDLAHLRSRAIDFSRQGIVLCDAQAPDMPIIDVNPAFEIMTGYSKQEVMGQNCRFLQGKNRDEAAAIAIRQALKNHSHVRVDIKNYRKDGTLFFNELSISPVFDDQNHLTHFIGIQQDITDRHVMLEKLLSEKERLEKYNAALQTQASQQRSIDDHINSLLRQAGFGR